MHCISKSISMKRIFTKKLQDWKSSPHRKPLIVRGARQVGKSYTITQLGKDHFKGKTHVVDFEKHPEWHRVFEKNLDPKRIVSEFEVLLDARISPGADLFFLDEIQACPRAITSLRYFYEELPELHVIAAGSLLEFAMKDISFPVGRISFFSLAPMNLFEFLLATGKSKLAEIIVHSPEKLPRAIHAQLLENLRQYMFIGGMPACVKAWCDSMSMSDVFSIQSDLLTTYQQDFAKYAPHTDKRSLDQVLHSVARNIGHPVKFTRLSDEFTGPTNKKATELLSMARIIHKVRSTSPASLPLRVNASEKKFKLLMVDIGLMRALNDLPPNIEYLKNDLLSMYQGALAEQFAGQELVSDGLEYLYYWSREAKNSSAEVDYLLTRDNEIVPLEIKGGAAGKLRSMHQILKEYPGIKKGYVLSTGEYGELPEQKLIFLPLYYAYGLSQ